MNLPGFDLGDQYCVPNEYIDFMIQSNINIIRLPIKPGRIFTDDSLTSFSEVWYKSNPDTCGTTDETAKNTGQYISTINYCIHQNIHVIIDLHDNDNGLKCFGSTVISSSDFVKMWDAIAQNVKTMTLSDKQDYIWFELYNEPIRDPEGDVDDYCMDTAGEKFSDTYDKEYQIPAIQAIQKYFPKNHILATTYGNWSGIHFWGGDDNDMTENCNSLNQLVNNLNKTTVPIDRSKIAIVGHQYCDGSYAGIGPDCDEQMFAKEKWTTWLSTVQRNIGDYRYIITETAINCPIDGGCNNFKLFVDWLHATIDQEQCLGFVLWYGINSFDEEGWFDFGGADLGDSTSKIGKQKFDIFTRDGFYKTSPDGNHYDFRNQFLSR